MGKMLSRMSLVVAVSTLVVLGVRPAGVAAQNVIISGTVTQLINRAGAQHNPSISGDIVVFTDESGVNSDVYYIRLSAPGVETLITGAGNQELHDIADPFIVYTDFGTVPTSVVVHDASQNRDLMLATGDEQTNPAIDGFVVFERWAGGTTHIATGDIVNGVTAPLIPGSTATDTEPAVSGTVVVFERRVTPTVQHIFAYDTRSLLLTDLGPGRTPEIDGTTVVYSQVVGSETDIRVHDLSTGANNAIVLPGSQTRPRISGDVVAFDDDHSGDNDVVLYHLTSGASVRIGDSGVNDHLNDIDANHVVYTSDKTGDDDIFLFTFTVSAPDDIPTLSEWGLFVMVALLLAAGAYAMRRRVAA